MTRAREVVVPPTQAGDKKRSDLLCLVYFMFSSLLYLFYHYCYSHLRYSWELIAPGLFSTAPAAAQDPPRRSRPASSSFAGINQRPRLGRTVRFIICRTESYTMATEQDKEDKAALDALETEAKEWEKVCPP